MLAKATVNTAAVLPVPATAGAARFAGDLSEGPVLLRRITRTGARRITSVRAGPAS
ncbi:hypothetical protein [Pseudarthrobacter sulfonivorans]|uniref:hypothetical protein n=1 Tax=Pseudarthrobacter sulfonivorans TaxID=121292 RepID=UPI000ABD6531|nr:hypothetical protein [Pseudarthrobacter sulfonivorans]